MKLLFNIHLQTDTLIGLSLFLIIFFIILACIVSNYFEECNKYEYDKKHIKRIRIEYITYLLLDVLFYLSIMFCLL